MFMIERLTAATATTTTIRAETRTLANRSRRDKRTTKLIRAPVTAAVKRMLDGLPSSNQKYLASTKASTVTTAQAEAGRNSRSASHLRPSARVRDQRDFLAGRPTV